MLVTVSSTSFVFRMKLKEIALHLKQYDNIPN